MTYADSPLYNAPARAPRQCPRCGRLFEEPFELDGVKVAGHVQGGPMCDPPATMLAAADRDARARRATRRGR